MFIPAGLRSLKIRINNFCISFSDGRAAFTLAPTDPSPLPDSRLAGQRSMMHRGTGKPS